MSQIDSDDYQTEETSQKKEHLLKENQMLFQHFGEYIVSFDSFLDLYTSVVHIRNHFFTNF
jgi:hypothetical protein